MTIPFKATYEHCSMYGSYHIPCEIHGWDDKREAFAIKFIDPWTGEQEKSWAEYDRVSDYTWPKLSEHFETNGWGWMTQ